MPYRKLLMVIWFWCLGSVSVADDTASGDTLRVYIDADYSIARGVALSIEQGLTAAFATRNFMIDGDMLEIVPVDHRANVRRSIQNIRDFVDDPQGLLVVGGKQSPPYITHLEEINESGVPMLLAWSAGGSITRYSGGPLNWLFRVSVDDRMAGPFIAAEMVANGCERIGLVVVDNGWGHGNRVAITSALMNQGIVVSFQTTVGREIGDARANEIASELSANQIDCMGMVGEDQSSALMIEALHASGQDIRVFSHWGFLGGAFEDLTSHASREAVSLRVLQTCGLEGNRRDNSVLQTAMDTAQDLGFGHEELSDFAAPAGFVHGYDIGLLLMAGIEQAQEDERWMQGVEMRRHAIRDALEALETPVRGILLTYDRPFSPTSDANPNGHDALSGNHLCMAAMDENGRLVPAGAAADVIEEARHTP